jgi:LmbE family N-acetylglucosaminyl deacetylase
METIAKRIIAKIKLVFLSLLGRKSYKWVVSDWVRLKDLEHASRLLTTKRFSRNLKSLVVNPRWRRKRVLVIAAHPDDEMVGSGGTLLLAARSGAELTCIYLTHGGGVLNDGTPDARGRQRKEEAAEVWSAIGGKVVHFDFADRGIPLTDAAAGRLADLVNTTKPRILFLPFLLDDHDDHRRANHLLLMAAGSIQVRKIEVWAYPVWSLVIPNVAVDITSVVDEKDRLNSVWKSQNADRDYVHLARGTSVFNTRFVTGKPIPKYAEVFFAAPLTEYLDLCSSYFSAPAEKLYYDLNGRQRPRQ